MKKVHFYFIPRSDSKALLWVGNFKENITTIGPQLGVTPAAITDLKDKAQVVIDALQMVAIKKAAYEEAVLAKNRARANELKFISNTAVILKRHPLFTENMGGALQILNSSSDHNRYTLQPVIKVNAFPGYVEVAFNKRGQPAVTIFSRLQGTAEWTELKNVSVSPYKDYRPLTVPGKPETREYIARCTDEDEFVGLNSEVGVVVFGG